MIDFDKIWQDDAYWRPAANWPLKLRIFENPRWQTAAISKIEKLRYLSNRLTDFYEIWHADAYWPPAPDRPLKFRIFENLRWRTTAILEIKKSRYFSNRLTNFNEIWHAGAYCQVLHNDKDYQVLFVGGPNMRTTNPRWQTLSSQFAINIIQCTTTCR